MKLIAGLLSSILVFAITATVFFYVLDGTLISASFLKHTAQSTNFYDNLAQELPAALAGSGPRAEATKTALSQVIKASYLERQVEDWFDGIEAFYKRNGPPPTLDLTSISDQAQVYGVALPTETKLNAPIVFTDPGLKPLVGWTGLAKLAGPVLIIVLVLLISLMLHGWGRYAILAKVSLVSGLTVGGLWLGAKALPSMISSLLTSQRQIGSLAPAIMKLPQAVAADLSRIFGIISLVLMAIAVLLIIVGLISKLGHRFGRHHSEPMRPDANDRLTLH